MKNIKLILDKYNITDLQLREIVKENHQKLAVMCYALNECEEVLLLERLKEPFKGKLVPPGGKVEKDEDIIEAVKREYLEETGLELSDIKFKVITSELGPPNYNWILFVFTGRVKKKPLLECEEGILQWVKKERLMYENLSNIDKKILPYVFDENKIVFLEIVYDKNNEGNIVKKRILSSTI